ncbi:MAG: xerD [Actinomycetia bacterium]|nr:xerD [Actinomycetes bacterium]
MAQAPVRQQRPRPEAPARPRAVRAVTWDEAVEAFIAAKESENISPSTVTNYRWHLTGTRARQFCSDHGITSPAQLNADTLRALQREVLAAGVSPALAHAFHRVWKNFAGFCLEQGYATEADVLRVKAPKQPMVEPEVFTLDDERRLLEAAAPGRDRMIVELMLRTGLRLDELLSLVVDDVVEGPEGAYLRVRQGKGRKDRIVPLDSPKAKLSPKLRQYIRAARPADASSPHLFLRTRRNGGEYTPLTRRGLQILMQRLGQRTGLHVHPHKFRHTFATRSLAAGVDVMALQRVLGHTTLAMVSRYVHYQKDDLLDAWRKRRD